MSRLNRACLLTFFLCWAGTLPFSPGHAQEKIRQYRIIDVHEHIQDKWQALKYFTAIKNNSISSIVLVGSPDQVLFEPKDGLTGFTGFEKNNSELLEISKMYPGKFHAFASFSPDDERMLEKLKSFLKRGGKGLKLYNGHYWFYDFYQIPLDAPHMMPVFEWCEKNRVPIIFHANARYYWPQLKHILDTYPELIVNLPHFCMSLIDLDRIATIFNSYPNVYSDISCGEGELAYTTLEYISRYWELYRGLIKTYKDRFLFGTDMVLTHAPEKDENYVTNVFVCYRKMLENKTYTGVLIDQYLEDNQIVKTKENSLFNGLQLDTDTLDHLYEINSKNFLGIP
ncbi:MAG: amidohydrolase [Desulfobacteraceae bacterium]|nr:amidohydrolase [Desulfobacteraceae bacterium]